MIIIGMLISQTLKFIEQFSDGPTEAVPLGGPIKWIDVDLPDDPRFYSMTD